MPRLIAFYLPQYHPIPENDEWWGKGFTEWTNVGKAKPMFRGHYQPHVPADLGYYDLRVPETRVAQADLARAYGIEAFCYYHYWFAGKRILERPLNEVLQSGRPDFPFCICWANQTWTGIWHGCPNKVLIEQTYPGYDDHQAHFSELLSLFLDKRYLTVDGKPLFVIYRPSEIPEVSNVLEFWRNLAVKSGLPGLHIVALMHGKRTWDPLAYGFDATLTDNLATLRRDEHISWRQPVRKVSHSFQKMLGRPTIHRYEDVLSKILLDNAAMQNDYPCLIPNWDNTPRSRSNGIVLHGSTPELFRTQVKKSLQLIENSAPEHKIIFVKAWNEWAEGNHLEPDLKYGKAFLNVIREEIAGEFCHER